MEQIRFNLLNEPWIDVIDVSGKRMELSIIDVFLRSAELSTVVDQSPVIEFGVYRFLTVFLAHAMITSGNNTIELGDGKIDMEIIKEYADKWFNRFDLFDPEHPFLQNVSHRNDIKWITPISYLFLEFPHGTNQIFSAQFSPKKVSASACARGLCAVAPFRIAEGGSIFGSINGGTAPWYIFPLGNTLAETLIINANGIIDSGIKEGDVPSWCLDDLHTMYRDEPVGVFRGLTWQSRIIQLIATDGGYCEYTKKESRILVSEMIYLRIIGKETKCKDTEWRDPHVAYKIKIKKKEKLCLPILPRTNKPFVHLDSWNVWNDVGWLLPLYNSGLIIKRSDIEYIIPSVFLNTNLSHAVIYGMASDGMAKILDWTRHEMNVSIYNGEEYLTIINTIDEIGKIIRNAMWRKGDTRERPIRMAINMFHLTSMEVFLSSIGHETWSYIRDHLIDAGRNAVYNAMKSISQLHQKDEIIVINKYQKQIMELGE